MEWSEHVIASAICRQTLQRKCLVLVDNCNWTGHECDVLGITMDRRIIDVEVKISRADLKADAKKHKWWCRLRGDVVRETDERGHEIRRLQHGIMHREHPPTVWKHYYALPAEIWEPGLLECLGSPASGVLLLSEDSLGRARIACERRAKPARNAYRLTDDEVLNVARLANLRMWDAYQARDQAIQGRNALAETVRRTA